MSSGKTDGSHINCGCIRRRQLHDRSEGPCDCSHAPRGLKGSVGSSWAEPWYEVNKDVDIMWPVGAGLKEEKGDERSRRSMTRKRRGGGEAREKKRRRKRWTERWEEGYKTPTQPLWTWGCTFCGENKRPIVSMCAACVYVYCLCVCVLPVCMCTACVYVYCLCVCVLPVSAVNGRISLIRSLWSGIMWWENTMAIWGRNPSVFTFKHIGPSTYTVPLSLRCLPLCPSVCPVPLNHAQFPPASPSLLLVTWTW